LTRTGIKGSEGERLVRLFHQPITKVTKY
jgi:hypothetical protein